MSHEGRAVVEGVLVLDANVMTAAIAQIAMDRSGEWWLAKAGDSIAYYGGKTMLIPAEAVHAWGMRGMDWFSYNHRGEEMAIWVDAKGGLHVVGDAHDTTIGAELARGAYVQACAQLTLMEIYGEENTMREYQAATRSTDMVAMRVG